MSMRAVLATLSLTLGLVLAVVVATASPAYGSPAPAPLAPLLPVSPPTEEVELTEVELSDEDAELLLAFLILLGLQADLDSLDQPAGA